MTHEQIKEQVIEFLERWSEFGPMGADSVEMWQDACGLDHISKNKFLRAVRSLAYKPGEQRVNLRRPRNLDGSRGVLVGLL